MVDTLATSKGSTTIRQCPTPASLPSHDHASVPVSVDGPWCDTCTATSNPPPDVWTSQPGRAGMEVKNERRLGVHDGRIVAEIPLALAERVYTAQLVLDVAELRIM